MQSDRAAVDAELGATDDPSNGWERAARKWEGAAHGWERTFWIGLGCVGLAFYLDGRKKGR